VAAVASSSASAATTPRGAGTGAEQIGISGIAAVPGSSGAWAVGTAYQSVTPYNTSAVIWKWSGTAWVTESIPNLGHGGSLTAIAATSSSNAWAAGSSGASFTSSVPVLLHWNGKSWVVVSFPKTYDKDYFGYLAASGSAVFVGGSTSGSASRPLLLDRTGSVWTAEKLPRLPTNAYLVALSATAASASGLWALTNSCAPTCSSQVLKPGKSGWSVVSVGKGLNLSGLAARTSTDVLAVGSGRAATGYGKLLIERYKGSSWSAMKVHSAVTTGALTGVSMGSATAGWAAGDAETTSSAAILVERLKGTSWQQTSVKIPGKNGLVDAFGGGSASAAWLFATSFAGKVCTTPNTIVAEHWNGSKWSAVKTPGWTIAITLRLSAELRSFNDRHRMVSTHLGWC
jgi:hypothetical protein